MRYVVLVTNNEGGPPAILRDSLEGAREWAKDYLRDPDIDPPMSADELAKLLREIDLIDGEFVQSVHTSDAWKERIYIAPVEDEKPASLFS